MTRVVNIAPEVAAAVGADGVKLATDPVRLQHVRCAECRQWTAADEPMELIVTEAGNMTRICMTHPGCLTSRVIELPPDGMADLMGIHAGPDAYCRCSMRITAPRGLLIIDMPATVFTLVGAEETQDVLVSLLLEDGFALYTEVSQALPLLANWSATFIRGMAIVARTGNDPLYEGTFDTTSDWIEEARSTGEIVVVTGSQLGIRDAQAFDAFNDERILDGRAVAARMSVKFDEALARSSSPARNDPCPCGSGRKYRRCHGR